MFDESPEQNLAGKYFLLVKLKWLYNREHSAVLSKLFLLQAVSAQWRSEECR